MPQNLGRVKLHCGGCQYHIQADVFNVFQWDSSSSYRLCLFVVVVVVVSRPENVSRTSVDLLVLFFSQHIHIFLQIPYFQQIMLTIETGNCQPL